MEWRRQQQQQQQEQQQQQQHEIVFFPHLPEGLDAVSTGVIIAEKFLNIMGLLDFDKVRG